MFLDIAYCDIFHLHFIIIIYEVIIQSLFNNSRLTW